MSGSKQVIDIKPQRYEKRKMKDIKGEIRDRVRRGRFIPASSYPLLSNIKLVTFDLITLKVNSFRH